MRKGVILFLAGIGLLFAGIVSTGDAIWGKQERTGNIPVDIGDATTIDLRRMGSVKVRFSDTEQPGLHDIIIIAGETNDIAERLVATRSGSTLRLAYTGDPFYGGILSLPTRITKVVVDDGFFEGGSRMHALRIEASGNVTWKGDAGTLTLASVAKESRRKRPSCRDDARCVQSVFSIDGGNIEALTVESRNGDIDLGDIDGIATIDLNVGPDAGLRVGHASDLARIHLRDSREAPPPATP